MRVSPCYNINSSFFLTQLLFFALWCPWYFKGSCCENMDVFKNKKRWGLPNSFDKLKGGKIREWLKIRLLKTEIENGKLTDCSRERNSLSVFASWEENVTFDRQLSTEKHIIVSKINPKITYWLLFSWC